MRGKVDIWLGDALVAAALLLVNTLLRHFVLPPIPNQMVGGFSEVVSGIYAKDPLSLLLPFPVDVGHRVHWTSTGLLLIEGVRRIIGLQWTYTVASGLCILLSYVAARCLTAPRSLAATYAGLFLFGSQLNYMFVHANVGSFYLYYCYVTINVLALAKLVGEQRRAWLPIFFVSLLATSLFLEIWLNYALFLVSFLLIVAVWSRVNRERGLASEALLTGGLTLMLVVSYVVIRGRYPDNLSIPGSEEEIIIRYAYLSLAVEDFLSNVVTYVHMCFSTYLPWPFMGSYSLTHLGRDLIIKEQNGYHPPGDALVFHHHVFLWYVLAGVTFTAFAIGLCSAVKRAFANGAKPALIVAGILLLILAGGASHSLIKYRAYMSAPVLAYKCVTGTFGVAVLIGFALHWIRVRTSATIYRLSLLGTWAVVLAAFIAHAHEDVALLKIVGLVAPTAAPFLRW